MRCKLMKFFLKIHLNRFNFFSTSHDNKISVVRSILNALPNIDSSEEFVVELIKAFNGMIQLNNRNKFSNTVRFL